jgi:hypothetical protein
MESGTDSVGKFRIILSISFAAARATFEEIGQVVGIGPSPARDIHTFLGLGNG